MDSGLDFIKTEFFNILFFQHKNLIIYPYVDLKHLHSLELFTVGYNVIDLESTALHNLKEILEFEANNSYSQNPSLFFIYNVNENQIKEIMELKGIRCIINTNLDVHDLANGSDYIFYNKKNNQFLNFHEKDIEFERDLISNSENEVILQDKIHKIKTTATRIFTELNQNKVENLPKILSEYDQKYWDKILTFTRQYYDIKVPKVTDLRIPPKSRYGKDLKDFSQEYEQIVSLNKHFGKEFIMLLHEYRGNRVNSSHLELEELFNPLKLYNYLRNHHWKKGIPENFLNQWLEMKFSQYKLTESDFSDFQNICNKLNIKNPSVLNFNGSDSILVKEHKSHVKKSNIFIPPVRNFIDFKNWLLHTIEEIDSLIDDYLKSDKDN
ncbi:MAG: hypothetical protein ACFE9T_01055 [Promethearchaeota archaeon]